MCVCLRTYINRKNHPKYDVAPYAQNGICTTARKKIGNGFGAEKEKEKSPFYCASGRHIIMRILYARPSRHFIIYINIYIYMNAVCSLSH